jgi:hypothetical protein
VFPDLIPIIYDTQKVVIQYQIMAIQGDSMMKSGEMENGKHNFFFKTGSKREKGHKDIRTQNFEFSKLDPNPGCDSGMDVVAYENGSLKLY